VYVILINNINKTVKWGSGELEGLDEAATSELN